MTRDELGLCRRCKEEPARPKHTCPYQTEINNDYEFKCRCCEECAYACNQET